MTRQMKMKWIAPIVALALVTGATVLAAAPQDPAQRPARFSGKLDVVISRFQGEKKVSNLPYTMLINGEGSGTPNGRGSIRMNVEVPIGSITTTRDGVTTTQANYRSVGTNIDANVSLQMDGRYSVQINVTDSSIIAAEDRANLPSPTQAAFRNFTAFNTSLMRDGQTTQFIVAADKITGEVTKVDVTFATVK